MTEQEAKEWLECIVYEEAPKTQRAMLLGIKVLEKHIPKKAEHIQGNPLWGYCPTCKKSISKGDSPIGCKWCLQRLDWGNEDAE